MSTSNPRREREALERAYLDGAITPQEFVDAYEEAGREFQTARQEARQDEGPEGEEE